MPPAPSRSPFPQVVDGTTLYFDGSAPKIVVAPSSDNTTPEAIQPTVTDQRARATDSQPEAVEIEGSVGLHQVIGDLSTDIVLFNISIHNVK